MTVDGAGVVRPGSEREVLRAAIASVRQRVPPRWDLDEAYEVSEGGGRPDAVLRLRSPDGEEAVFVVEAKNVLEGRDVPSVQARLARWADVAAGPGGMVVARYLSGPVRQRLAAAGLSYADATGNLLVRADRPGLYVADRGADKDPWRGPGRPRGDLRGEPAAKVVRALVDEVWPWPITELVRRSHASTGSVYRVVQHLEAEGLAVRDREGRVEVRDWVELLRRWSQDYQFIGTNTISRWIAPRGLDNLVSRVRDGAVGDYAVTGTIAASRYASYAPARNAMIYVADAARAADAWGLRGSDSGVNVLLVEPAYPFMLDPPNVNVIDGSPGGATGQLRIVKPAQIAVDLMTGPGRAPAEAEELLEWMRSHEGSWRGSR